MSRRLAVPYDPDRARRDYEELGPLTVRDARHLLGLDSVKRVSSTLVSWYGAHGARHARAEWARLRADFEGLHPAPVDPASFV